MHGVLSIICSKFGLLEKQFVSEKRIDSDACTISLTVKRQCVYPKTIIKTLTVFHFRIYEVMYINHSNRIQNVENYVFITAVVESSIAYFIIFIFLLQSAYRDDLEPHIESNKGVFRLRTRDISISTHTKQVYYLSITEPPGLYWDSNKYIILHSHNGSTCNIKINSH